MHQDQRLTGRGPTNAVEEGVSFTAVGLDAGNGTVALYGPSGCGKTAPLRCLAGVEALAGSDGNELRIASDGVETDLNAQPEHSHEFERGTEIRLRFQPTQPQTDEINP